MPHIILLIFQGSTHENLGQIHEAIKMFESQLSISVQVADHAGQTSALANLGELNASYFVKKCRKIVILDF